MSAHIRHTPATVGGLVDGCPRCEEHAGHPLESLDASNLRSLWERMVAFEYDDDEKYRPRSDAEAKAMKIMLSHAQFLRRIGYTRAHLWGVTF